MFLVDPNGVVRHTVVNDLPVGRSVDETLRVLKAFQFVEKHGEGKIFLISFLIISLKKIKIILIKLVVDV